MKELLFGVIATVMVSGLFLGSIGSDAFAISQQGKDNGEARGCDNADNNKIKDKNPHCEELVEQTWYQDKDGDGLGNPDVSQVSDTQPPGWVLDNTDCDDNDSTAPNPNPCTS